jgi:diketogulonate reductase-like aldo/keto reductase
MAVAQHSGLVKAVGVSNYSEREMRALHAELAKQGIPLATNQIEARRRLRWHSTG